MFLEKKSDWICVCTVDNTYLCFHNNSYIVSFLNWSRFRAENEKDRSIDPFCVTVRNRKKLVICLFFLL